MELLSLHNCLSQYLMVTLFYIHHFDYISLEALTMPPFYLLFLPPLLPYLFLIAMSFMSFCFDFVFLSMHFQVQRLEWEEKNM